MNSLHWLVGDLDLGVGGVSFVELLILYELWTGERLSLEKAHPRYLRLARPISVSAVPFGLGIDIWRSCRFIGALMRSLCLLPGGLARFVPCFIGANHCRLRHIGWEKCGHGLTSRSRESASAPFLDELLFSLSLSWWVWACFACWHSSPSLLLWFFLLAGPLLGGCLLLVVLLIWLLPMLQMGIGLFLQLVVGFFLGGSASCHGLTSRPRESASELFLNELF